MVGAITITVEHGDQLNAVRSGVDQHFADCVSQRGDLQSWIFHVEENAVLPAAGCREVAEWAARYIVEASGILRCANERFRPVAEHHLASPEEDLDLSGDATLAEDVIDWLRHREQRFGQRRDKIARLIKRIEDACGDPPEPAEPPEWRL